MAVSSSSPTVGASNITTPLTHDEQAQVEDHYHILLHIASIVAPRWDDAISVGYFGLVAGLRTYRPDGGASLETWLRTKIESAIRDGLRREKSRRMVSLDVLADEDGFDVEDRRGAIDADTAAMVGKVAELSDDDQDLVWAYLSTGNLDKAAAEIGMPQAVARRRMKQIRTTLQNLNAQIDS